MKKILIVEDNELNVKLFYDILVYHNYEVDKALDGEEAFEKIKDNLYDLIILDIQLPKMSGFEVLQKIKDENIKVQEIIVVSACAMDVDKQNAAAFGIQDYITKPIDINNFLKMVKLKLG